MFLSLSLCFTAVHVSAANGKLSLFAENSGLVATDNSIAARYMSRSGQAPPEAAQDMMIKDRIFLAGVIGNLVGIFGGWKLGDVLSTRHERDHIAPGSLLWAMVGSVCGSALGVYSAGNTKEVRGNSASAIDGGMLGVLAAIGVSIPMILLEGVAGLYVAMGAFAILPPVIAANSFRKSLRPRSLPAGNALLNLSEGKLGLGIPDIQIRALPAYGKNMKAEFQFKINVLNMVL